MKVLRYIPLATVLASAVPALGSDQPGVVAWAWREDHTATSTLNGTRDAGPLVASANFTRGDGPLLTLTGILTPGGSGTAAYNFDADLHCISITSPTTFSAVTGGSADTCLALFDAAGHGIAFNDNRTDSGTSLGSRLTNTFTSSLSPGLYFLGISLNNGNAAGRKFTRPLDAAGGLMFPGPAYNAPDDAGGPNDTARRAEVAALSALSVLTAWETVTPTSFASPFTSSYTITLTGAGFHQIPAPGAAGLLGFGGLMLARRRR